jgi:hypothetical protein
MNLADVIRILELVNQTLTTLKELGVNLNGVNAAGLVDLIRKASEKPAA